MSSDWRPTASLNTLQARAHLIDTIRSFLKDRGVLEVHTSTLGSATVSTPDVDSHRTRDGLYLQTSPEFQMKRLLAEFRLPIFQICPAYRRGEEGRLHNPEFLMLEWYRPRFSLEDLLTEALSLIYACSSEVPVVKTSARKLLVKHIGVDYSSSDRRLAHAAGNCGLGSATELSRSALLAFLIDVAVKREATIQSDSTGSKTLIVIGDYPCELAELAQVVDMEHGPVADRFEIVAVDHVDGAVRCMELANAYSELRDADELERRTAVDNEIRRSQSSAVVDTDQRLLEAMRSGLPACSGIAMGIDRLLVWVLHLQSIDQAIPFPRSRA